MSSQEAQTIQNIFRKFWIVLKTLVFCFGFGVIIIAGKNIFFGYGQLSKANVTMTKGHLRVLETALKNFQITFGRFPHLSNDYTPLTVNEAETIVIEDDEEKNILFNKNLNTKGFSNLGISDYSIKWQGPYLPKGAKDFIRDAWGQKIRYFCFGTSLYLHSPGPDGIEDKIKNVIRSEYQGDDIILKVDEIEFKN